MKTLLWLDDFRDPHKDDWLNFSPIPPPFDVIWVTTYEGFVHWIERNGLPDGICFDHDLADNHYHNDMYVSPEAYNKHYDEFEEKTGYHAAKWLIDYCIDNDKELPKFNIQSANPVGKENIKGLLNSFIKHYPKIREMKKNDDDVIDYTERLDGY